MKLFLFFVLFCCVVVGEKHHKSRPDGFDVQQFFKNRGVIEVRFVFFHFIFLK